MKRLSPFVGLAVALLAAALCVRLGFWQISRLHEKEALNADLRAALAAPPAPLPGVAPGPGTAPRRYQARGRFDQRHQLLLIGRAQGGEPGVDVLTPLQPEDGGPAVLINRGFLPAFDAATAHPQDAPEPAGVRTVVGLLEPFRRGPGPGGLRLAEDDSLTVWSTPWLDADSLARVLPYPVRPYVLRELPGPGVPERPARVPPRPYDESMHRGYAVQWFSFALIIVVGSVVLLVRSRRPPV